MTREWKCGRCGRTSAEHGDPYSPSYRCLYIPVLVGDSKPEAQGDVVGKETEMIQAFNNADPSSLPILIDQRNIRRMTAALRVALDEALGPVTEDEWHEANLGTLGWAKDAMNSILASRRARLLPSTNGTLTAHRDQPDDFEQFTSGLRKPVDAPIGRRKP
jgi:hypothetical protein